MTYNNRRVNNQSPTARTVSYNSGGLNERFSKIVNMQKNEPARGKSSGNAVSSKNASVFSRLRGSKPVNSRVNNNIKNRLGKTIGGGIKKNSNRPTPMAGVVKTGSGNKRVVAGKRGGVVAKKSSLAAKKKVQAKGGKKGGEKKKLTAEDLDKALDNYMMKDPKAARARLDDDMNAYMAEAEDILMSEDL